MRYDEIGIRNKTGITSRNVLDCVSYMDSTASAVDKSFVSPFCRCSAIDRESTKRSTLVRDSVFMDVLRTFNLYIIGNTVNEVADGLPDLVPG